MADCELFQFYEYKFVAVRTGIADKKRIRACLGGASTSPEVGRIETSELNGEGNVTRPVAVRLTSSKVHAHLCPPHCTGTYLPSRPSPRLSVAFTGNRW